MPFWNLIVSIYLPNGNSNLGDGMKIIFGFNLFAMFVKFEILRTNIISLTFRIQDAGVSEVAERRRDQVWLAEVLENLASGAKRLVRAMECHFGCEGRAWKDGVQC